jgi:hypothetical protein
MLKIFDFHCDLCETTHEALIETDREWHPCPKCEQMARKVIGIPGAHCANEDAPWIRSICEVVDKDSRKPHNVEFLRNPTRTNLKRWMEGEGVRWFEKGEKPQKPPIMSDAERVRKTFERHRKRTALEI